MMAPIAKNPASNSGTVLLIVAGLAAILAAMTLAFLLRMRSDAEETDLFAKEVQARTMLTAGLNYIQETARLGWNDETYGWWDPRDGRAGPKDINGNPAKDPITGSPLFTTSDDPAVDGYGSRFPGIAGKAARCPMYRMRRPPYAVSNVLAPNEVKLDPALSWAQLISNEKPNPQAVASTWTEFADGDTRSAESHAQPAWFRIYRLSKARFVITCGCGNSLGYRDWAEVVADGAEDLFGTMNEFLAIRAEETIFWYEAEWNSAVGSNIYYHYNTTGGTFQLGDISSPYGHWDEKNNSRQFGGTFTYIERLPKFGETLPPANW